jgi:hypothetical protein
MKFGKLAGWLIAAPAAVLVACGGGGGGSAGGSGSTGTLKLALTDAPACGYKQVNVSVEKIRIHKSESASETDSGWSEIALSPAHRVDLLSLTNGVLHELGQTPLEPGKYTQMRLVLSENSTANPTANSVVLMDNSEVPLTTPSGQSSGVKIKTNIDISATQMADYVLDFDACKSVHVVKAGKSGNYLLKPQLRLIPRYVNGVLGYVMPTLANGLATASLQQAGGVVRTTVSDSNGRFLLQPVNPGTYTLVVTAAGYTTMIVNSVPVVTDTVTRINSTTTALSPVTSTLATLMGTVTTAVSPIDAFVHVKQPLSSGTIEWGSQPVDATTGVFNYSVPVGSPKVANYVVVPAVLSFSDDAPAAGKYSLEAISGGVTQTSGPYTLSTGSTQTATFSFP